MSKVWQKGDMIGYEELNTLQEKADKYDELTAKAKTEKAKPEEVKGKKK